MAGYGKNIPIDSTKKFYHEIDHSIVIKIGPMDILAPNTVWKKTGTIDIPNIVGPGKCDVQWRTAGETAPSKATRAKVLETRGITEHCITPAEERRDPICEVNHCGTIDVIRGTRIENIVIHIGCDHDQLIDEGNKKRLIFTGPCNGQCFLQDIVPHAVGNNRNFCLACFGRIDRRNPLLFQKIIEQIAQNIGKRFGTLPGM